MKSFFTFSLLRLLALFLLALRLPAAAQAPAWQSAQAVATATAAAATNASIVTATAVDATGNVFLAGYFENSVVLGSTTLTSLGGTDVFVAKFSPANNQFIWAQRAGGGGFSSDERATALVVRGSNVYVTGYFGSPTASFGPVTLTNASVGSHADIFVAKLTDAGSTGSFVWVQQAGGADDDYATALAVSGSSVYVTGYFTSSTVEFGATTLTNAVTNVTYSPDAFVAKLADAGSTGSFAWAQRAGGTNLDYATALAVSGSSVYMAGRFSSPTASFGPVTLTTAGNIDTFVAKLTDAGSTGSFVWVQQAGGASYTNANALAVSGPNVYVAGIFVSPAAKFGSTTLTTIGSGDVFVAKLTDAGPTGSFVWAQRAGGTGEEEATALAVSGSSVYVAGRFSSSTAGFGSATLTTTGSNDVFVAKLTDAGSTSSFAWAQQAVGTGYDAAKALSVSGSSVYVAGSFGSPTLGFGPVTLANPSASYNVGLGFLASLTDATPTATAPGRTLAPAQLYPNPARHTATLRLPAGTAPAPLTLSDALGRTVRRYPAPAGPEATLDLRGLTAGLYLLQGTGPAQRLQVE